MRRCDIKERRKEILAAVVHTYIKTATPVSSEYISKGFDFSSATIRNVFSDLEEEEYLTHPHTSAGRIPTDKGYRYYVDFLCSQIVLIEEEKQRICAQMDIIEKEIHQIEGAFEFTSKVISRLTGNTGIVAFVDSDENGHMFCAGFSSFAEYPEFKNVDRLKQVLKVLDEKRMILDLLKTDMSDKVKIYIGKELQWPEIEECSLIISNYQLKNSSTGWLAVLGPKRMDYDRLIPTLEYLSRIASEVFSHF